MLCDIYCRVSTTEQAEEGFSLDEQERKLRAYAEAQGWTVNACYTDPGFSGAKLDRPGIQAVIKDARERRIQKVVTYKLDRLSRSQKDTLYLIEDVFLANEVDYVSMTESIDTGTPFGMAMIGILAVFAQLERETIKERMVTGRIAAIKDGKWRGGHGVPIGYKYIPKSADREGRLVVDPYEAELVRTVFDEFMSGKNYDSITRIANAYPLPGRKAQRGTNFARECLQNRFYIGQVRVNDEWYPGNQEPIIDEELFWKVQARMAEYSAEISARLYRPRQYGHLLNGFSYCAVCGARMRYVGQKYRRKDGRVTEQRYYLCSYRNGIRQPKNFVPVDCNNPAHYADELEELVWSQIESLNFQDIISSAPSGKHTESIKALESKLQELERQQEKLIDLYTVGSLPMDAIRKRSEEITADIKKVRAQLEQLQASVPAADPHRIMQALERVKEVRSESLEAQREVLQVLIKRIEVGPDELKIIWNI